MAHSLVAIQYQFVAEFSQIWHWKIPARNAAGFAAVLLLHLVCSISSDVVQVPSTINLNSYLGEGSISFETKCELGLQLAGTCMLGDLATCTGDMTEKESCGVSARRRLPVSDEK